jgi:hypothetical protein
MGDDADRLCRLRPSRLSSTESGAPDSREPGWLTFARKPPCRLERGAFVIARRPKADAVIQSHGLRPSPLDRFAYARDDDRSSLL